MNKSFVDSNSSGFVVPIQQVQEYFDGSFELLNRYFTLLESQGELRGLIGKREVSRLWERHILNCAVLQNFIVAPSETAGDGFVHPQLSSADSEVNINELDAVTSAERQVVGGVLVDVGSGAGLPGVVVACLFPNLQVHLIESMQRRVQWLNLVRQELQLANLLVHAGRAEELQQVGDVPQADFVTARAVASLDKLLGWTMPFLKVGGQLLALKGKSVRDEIKVATKQIRKYSPEQPQVYAVRLFPELEPTYVLQLQQ